MERDLIVTAVAAGVFDHIAHVDNFRAVGHKTERGAGIVGAKVVKAVKFREP